MRLLQLLNSVSINEIINYADVEVTNLTHLSKNVTNGCMFFCIRGQNFDGNAFAPMAVSNGANVLVCDKALDVNAVQIIVDDVRIAMALIAKNFYDNAIDKMRLISVVGTNGKTSTSYMIDSILRHAGRSVGLIGTNGAFIKGEHIDTQLTTPDPIEMHRLFSLMYENKVTDIVMEVSAHAIALNKVYGIKADIAVFTNFSQDHLDFFKTMKQYRQVKKSYFSSQFCKLAVINADDDLGQELINTISIPQISYGCNNPSDCFAIDCISNSNSISYIMNLFDEVKCVKYSLSGKFNIYNTLAASVCCRSLGINIDLITQGINKLKQIDGRNISLFNKKGSRIVIDFAHTPDGISNICSYLKQSTQGKLIVVFGCGGNRDKFKRPLMANTVSMYADYAIITNDNPRYEDQQEITDDIIKGINISYEVIFDRAEAIAKAIEYANENDTVAILGKGNEKYQEINGEKFVFDDIEVVRSLI